MIYWAQLLHFYQPPTQFHPILEKVCQESYHPLLRVLRAYPHARVTVNMNAVLTELLHQHGYEDVIRGLRELAEAGQIEFTGSGKYHPILPLLPQDEVRRQVQHNLRANRQFFGPAYAPQGFFPPEMCYSKDILEPMLESGHQWFIMSGVGCPAKWPMDIIHQVSLNGEKIAVIFRDDILSNKISFQQVTADSFLKHVRDLRGKRENCYVVTAMDAETYGHHIKDWEKLFLAQVYEELEPAKQEPLTVKQTQVLAEQHRGLLASETMAKEVKMVTVSELLDLFPKGDIIEPKPSSWSTSDQDIASKNPYPLWASPDNEVHRVQWQHLKMCIDMVKKAKLWADTDGARDYGNIARGLLDRALHSDQFWWASRRPWWEINLINKGLLQQEETMLNAYKSIKSSRVDEERKAEYFYRFVAADYLRAKIFELLFQV